MKKIETDLIFGLVFITSLLSIWLVYQDISRKFLYLVRNIFTWVEKDKKIVSNSISFLLCHLIKKTDFFFPFIAEKTREAKFGKKKKLISLGPCKRN